MKMCQVQVLPQAPRRWIPSENWAIGDERTVPEYNSKLAGTLVILW